MPCQMPCHSSYCVSESSVDARTMAVRIAVDHLAENQASGWPRRTRGSTRAQNAGGTA